MQINPLRNNLKIYLTKHQLNKKFDKQIKILADNPSYPSLHVELLEPRTNGIYSFRIDRKYRALFIFIAKEEIEIIDVNDHYQ